MTRMPLGNDSSILPNLRLMLRRKYNTIAYADTFEEAKSAMFSDLEYDGVDTETVFIETVYKVEVKSVEEIKED